jgi:hypothetical protein
MKTCRLLILFVAFAILSGCAGYEQLYSQYMSQCSLPQNQKVIEVPQTSGQPIKINQGCVLAPPTDPDAKYWMAGATLGGALINQVGGTIRAVSASHDNRDIINSISANAGARVGGDAVIGNGNGKNQTDSTAPPPEPIIVPAGSDVGGSGSSGSGG